MNAPIRSPQQAPLRSYLRRAKAALERKTGWYSRRSYSQSGEDLIVRFIFDAIGIERPRFLDIGAHHPVYLNNTYLLYRQGCRGVNVEPDPKLFAHFPRIRRGDRNLNVGVGTSEGTLDFFVMSQRTLNTFSESEALRYAAEGSARIMDRMPVQVRPVNDIVAEHFVGAPEFVSIDVEGLDWTILQAFDLPRFRPKVFCIETVTFSAKGQSEKLSVFDEYMDRHGYFKYADTYINSIYVCRDAWRDGMARRA
jgi:FkbM family methyltransferase